MPKINLTESEQQQIAEILNRRANEIARFSSDYQRNADHHGSVELGLSREIKRLRHLAYRVQPPKPEEDCYDE